MSNKTIFQSSNSRLKLKELAEAPFSININPAEQKNLKYVDGYLQHNGQLCWILNKAGSDFIFSDEVYENHMFITERVPFKNHSHYIYKETLEDVHPKLPKVLAYAWYSKCESFVEQFDSESKALDWLVGPEEDLSLENEEINPDALYNTDELIGIWFNSLLEATGKVSVEDLTCEEIKAEIDEIKGTINNERMWALSDSMHSGNIVALSEYLNELNVLLEKVSQPPILDDVIASCEEASINNADEPSGKNNIDRDL